MALLLFKLLNYYSFKMIYTRVSSEVGHVLVVSFVFYFSDDDDDDGIT